jgi:hypothetical protein
MFILFYDMVPEINAMEFLGLVIVFVFVFVYVSRRLTSKAQLHLDGEK